MGFVTGGGGAIWKAEKFKHAIAESVGGCSVFHLAFAIF